MKHCSPHKHVTKKKGKGLCAYWSVLKKNTKHSKTVMSSLSVHFHLLIPSLEWNLEQNPKRYIKLNHVLINDDKDGDLKLFDIFSKKYVFITKLLTQYQDRSV